MLPKSDHISYSQIRAGKCPKYYRYVYLEGKCKQNELMFRGKLFHIVLDEYLKECKEHKIEKDVDLMNDILNKNHVNLNLRKVIFGILDNLYIDSLFESEYRIDIDLGKDSKDKNIIFRSIIDRVNMYTSSEGTVIEIIDYKTGGYLPDKAKIEADLQLNLYLYAIVKRFDYFDFVRTGFFLPVYNCYRFGDYKKVKEIDFRIEEHYIKSEWERLKNRQEEDYDKIIPCSLCADCYLECEFNCNEIDNKVREYRRLILKSESLKKEIKKYYENKEPEMIDEQKVGYELTNKKNKFFI